MAQNGKKLRKRETPTRYERQSAIAASAARGLLVLPHNEVEAVWDR